MNTWTAETDTEAVRILTDAPNVEKNRLYYHVRQHFELVELGGVRRVRKKCNGKFMATEESFTNIIQDIHIATGQKSETKTFYKIQETYANITKAGVRSFIVNCERCAEKAKKKLARSVVVRSISASSLNERGQVDLIDYRTEPDGDNKWVMHYEEHLSEFSVLRPLTQKLALLVAKELFNIFITFGAPHILQSDNGREFTAEVISEVASLWPQLVLINGRPRYPQSQGSIERANASVKVALTA